MNKLIETMTPDEKANLLVAVSKALEANKIIGTYTSVKEQGIRVIHEILKSIN
jgi:hypothetical protein